MRRKSPGATAKPVSPGRTGHRVSPGATAAGVSPGTSSRKKPGMTANPVSPGTNAGRRSPDDAAGHGSPAGAAGRRWPGADPRREAAASFAATYGEPPEAVAFAPGRVNLIGEHLDYCGLPVLPAALRHGVALAFRRRDDDRLRCRSAAFPTDAADFRLPESEAPPPGGFARYLAAAATGLRAGNWVDAGANGWEGAIASSLPPASGLSSSSAVVVAAALAHLVANDRLAPGDSLSTPEKRRLAADLAAAERGVAIRGGAMDQSVCLGARRGHALRIASEPPAWTPIPVPESRFAFLAAFSGQRAEKGGAAKHLYNTRVVEAAAAFAEAGRALGLPGRPAEILAARPPEELLRAARRLPPPLDRRLRHLVTETHRVEEAARCLAEGDAGRLGEILDASHRSLRDDYRVSTPELDALVTEARNAGALGARLTGAGLGGSVVVLSPPAARPAIRAALEERFYGPRNLTDPPERRLLDADPAGPAALTAP